MLLFSFICSIIFSIVFFSFIICLIVMMLNKKKIDNNVDNLLNGFETFDLSVGGTNDKEKKE